jgi:TonB family protein
MKPLLLLFQLVLGVLPFGLLNAQHANTVNSQIGDESYVALYGVLPDERVDERLRIQTHLAYVEALLREKEVLNLSTTQTYNRQKTLDHLRAYWQTGEFPANYDHRGKRIPCFIDKTGRICAVGYLIEQTAGRETAEKINSLYQYAFLLNMNDAVVDDWITQNGLTKQECAMIQPSYDYKYRTDPVPDKPVKIKTDSSEFVYESTQVDTSARFVCETGKDPQTEWNNFIKNNLVYPKMAIEAGQQGTVVVSCVVKKDGSLSNFKIMRGSSTILNKEALRVAALPSKWIPAYLKGKPVNSTYLFPIRFRLPE